MTTPKIGSEMRDIHTLIYLTEFSGYFHIIHDILQINLLNDSVWKNMHIIESCINAYNFMAPWEFHFKFMTTQATEVIYIYIYRTYASLLLGIMPKKKGLS